MAIQSIKIVAEPKERHHKTYWNQISELLDRENPPVPARHRLNHPKHRRQTRLLALQRSLSHEITRT